jgi:hypothetical protein
MHRFTFVFRNNANTDISNDLVRKKPIHQFHERPHHSNKDSTSTLDNVANENKNSELSYNDIYKQMSVPKHANDKYENKHGSEKKRNQFSIKNLFSSFSNNHPTVESFENKGVDENQGNLISNTRRNLSFILFYFYLLLNYLEINLFVLC